MCLNKKPNEKMTIVSSDRDLSQLIDDDIRLYLIDKKTFITKENFKEHFGFHYENVAIIKILCGDVSDSIKGVKRLGDGTLLKLFPEIIERKVTIDEIVEKAKNLQSDRLLNKKSKLQVLTNIIDGNTDGVQGDKLYEINKLLVDLKKPMLTEYSINKIDNLIHSNLSDDRSIKNVYKMLKSDGIDVMLGEKRYEDYLLPFKKLIEREKNNDKLIN
jgi:5'-3' exonuclease